MSMFISGSKFLLAAAASAALVACGGGGGSSSAPIKAASANTSVAIGPANGAAATAAVSGQTFAFASGVAALGTTASTTVALTSGAAGAPAKFDIASGTGKATGALTYGSCIFTVAAGSTIPSLPAGTVVTVNPCTLGVATTGLAANDVPQNGSATLTLGTTTSAALPLTVTISASGSVSINGSTVGTVATGNHTGS